uniref:Uncharacterized protein n=1 Tax=Romanomermis culicivorax TaxID=13658 RepID=A0A915HKC0_ROMCU
MSPLQCDAEVQTCLEALKNLQKLEFKVPLPPMLLIYVEQAASFSTSFPMTTASLPPRASMAAPSSTVVPTMSLQPTASRTAQQQLVITTCPVLGAAPVASAVFALWLPSEATTLSNYAHFPTTDLSHCVMLTTLRFLPHLDPSVDSFSLRILHEMVLINFFGRIGVHIMMAVHIRSTNTLLALYKFFPSHFRTNHHEPQAPVSSDVAALILR